MIPILKKVLEELAKENPKLDYIRGMLETVVEMQTDTPVAKPIDKPIPMPKFPYTKPITDDASMIDAQAAIALSKLPPVQYE